jgi:Tfp pilus assembly protein PilX
MPVRTRGNAKAKRRAWRATGPGAPDREGGFALILVISVMTALLLGALVAVQNVTGYLPVAGTDVQRQAALAAAEAGVDDYLNRLNQDPNYWSDESGNVAMQPNGWVKVCDSCIGEFHYSVSTADMLDYHETNTLTGSWGTIYLKSTGKVGNVTRTVEVGMREDFLKNLYLSEYNIVDPEMMTLEWAGDHSAPTLTQLEDYCSVYAYQHNTYSGGTGPDMNTIPGTDESCYGLINYWVSGQTVNGPMQANDEYYIIGNPDFTQAVSTADFNVPGDSPYWEDPTCGGFPTPLRCGGDSPTFNPTYNPGGVPIGNGGTVSLPASIFGSSVPRKAASTTARR